MGSSLSIAGITEEILQDYVDLTYLTKSEIIYVLKQFYSLGPEEMERDFHFRFHKSEIVKKFPVLKHNPFSDRIFHVFSSLQDDHFSFEDMLDLCSVMSENCPDTVKASWAFKIYDLDDDNQINIDDLCETIDRLSWDVTEPEKLISNNDKVKVAKILLNEMDLQYIGSLGPADFLNLVSKMPEFKTTFYFKV